MTILGYWGIFLTTLFDIGTQGLGFTSLYCTFAGVSGWRVGSLPLTKFLSLVMFTSLSKNWLKVAKTRLWYFWKVYPFNFYPYFIFNV